jgi:hypothetical protein
LREGFYRMGQGLAVGVGFGGGIGSAAVFHRQGRQGEFEFREATHVEGLW